MRRDRDLLTMLAWLVLVNGAAAAAAWLHLEAVRGGPSRAALGACIGARDQRVGRLAETQAER